MITFIIIFVILSIIGGIVNDGNDDNDLEWL